MMINAIASIRLNTEDLYPRENIVGRDVFETSCDITGRRGHNHMLGSRKKFRFVRSGNTFATAIDEGLQQRWCDDENLLREEELLPAFSEEAGGTIYGEPVQVVLSLRGMQYSHEPIIGQSGREIHRC